MAAKLGDFGMARSKLSSDQAAAALLSGKPYFSPEKIQGNAVQVQADAWGVGAILFEMFTKQRQF